LGLPPQSCHDKSRPKQDDLNPIAIVGVTLDEDSIGRSGARHPSHERAICDLRFDRAEPVRAPMAPTGRGSVSRCISAITGSRLMFDIRREDGTPRGRGICCL